MPDDSRATMPAQTVLYVSPMTLGDETRVRLLHRDFPVEALERGAGVRHVRAFIGSGFYALEITVDDGDFQQQFHRFLDTPAVASFFAALAPHVQGLPRPGEETAEMPLAASMLAWERGTGRVRSRQPRVPPSRQRVGSTGCFNHDEQSCRDVET